LIITACESESMPGAGNIIRGPRKLCFWGKAALSLVRVRGPNKTCFIGQSRGSQDEIRRTK